MGKESLKLVSHFLYIIREARFKRYADKPREEKPSGLKNTRTNY